MPLRPRFAGILLIAFLMVASCSKDRVRTAPAPTYSLSGRLRLAGTLTDADGVTLGERSVDDAGGIKVYLVADSVVIDSTFTQGGRYAFRVALGTYLAFARIGAAADSSSPVHVHDTDRAFPDTIQLRSTAGMTVAPNPFTTSMRALYTLATAGQVHLDVLALDGSRVRGLVAGTFPAGRFAAIWDGLDDGGLSAPPGSYWIALEESDANEGALVFREGVAINGPVELVGNLFSELGEPMGIRGVTDADWVRVRLLGLGRSLDSTFTHGGRYDFRVTAAGTYRATTWVDPSQPVATPDIVVTGNDVAVPDTLKLVPAGELRTSPNPFSSGGVGIEFTIDQSQTVEIVVLDLIGTPMWFYSFAAPAGFNHIHWPGTDSGNHPVPNGRYWAIVKMGGQERFNLVFKE